MARRFSDSEATASIREALKKRFERPAWALFEEVGNATGTRCNRHADAVAMSLWPSRGLHLHGVEIKASRSDWTKELSDPAKADEIARYCDFWWVAVANEKIVQAGELPPTWGLLVLTGDKLVCKAEAKQLEALPIDRSFLAAVLRRAAEAMPALITDAEYRGFMRGCENGPAEHRQKLHEAQEELRIFKTQLDEFEAASGIKITRWNGGDIGAAVNKLMRSRFAEVDPLAELDDIAGFLDLQARKIREHAQTRREAVAKMPKGTEAA